MLLINLTRELPLWNELLGLSSSINMPWCVMGDFNCVVNMDEILGGREHWTPDMQDFKDCISHCGLGHISTVGPLFTWTNKRLNDPVFKRLDRMLGNQHWFSIFTNCVALVKPRGLMGHHPLVLHVPMELDKVDKTFQFLNL